MRIKGALHVHSKFSHDGALSIAEVGSLYLRRGFQFVAIGEHSQDMDATKITALVEQCAACSNDKFLLVPGIEYSCSVPGMHILGVGSVELARDAGPLTAAHAIREAGGFAVLAHPCRFGWRCGQELLDQLDAIEVWNVGYDGKYLPPAAATKAFRRMKLANPRLLAVASHDLHREPTFYDVAIEMEVEALTRDVLVAKLRGGEYRIRSRYFNCDSEFEISWTKGAMLRMFSSQLSRLRQMRFTALQWSA